MDHFILCFYTNEMLFGRLEESHIVYYEFRWQLLWMLGETFPRHKGLHATADATPP